LVRVSRELERLLKPPRRRPLVSVNLPRRHGAREDAREWDPSSRQPGLHLPSHAWLATPGEALAKAGGIASESQPPTAIGTPYPFRLIRTPSRLARMLSTRSRMPSKCLVGTSSLS
jgi:hypothetical protein